MKQILLLSIITLALSSCNESAPAPSQSKLKSVTSYIQDQSGEFRPGEKTVYTYSVTGLLETSEQLQYDTQDKQFHHFSTDTYTYNNGLLARIDKNILDWTKKTTTRYEYANGKISSITNEDELTTTATVHELASDTIEVFYQFSNGRSLTYKFYAKSKNITYEKTIGDDLQLASVSKHEYDNFNNPYSLLGYTDLFFTNYSANNKITSTSNYYSLAFPQSTPIAYEYEYNSLNFPTQQITTYKSTGSSGRLMKSKTVFEYVD